MDWLPEKTLLAAWWVVPLGAGRRSSGNVELDEPELLHAREISVLRPQGDSVVPGFESQPLSRYWRRNRGTRNKQYNQQCGISRAAATRKRFIEMEYRNYAGRNTGLSTVFPSQETNKVAHGLLIHRWTDGREVSRKNLEIQANNRLIGLVTEILPPESASFSASGDILVCVEIDFDQDVFIQALQLRTAETGQRGLAVPCPINSGFWLLTPGFFLPI